MSSHSIYLGYSRIGKALSPADFLRPKEMPTFGFDLKIVCPFCGFKPIGKSGICPKCKAEIIVDSSRKPKAKGP